MTDIIFYDFGFNRLRECSRPVSVNIERCYCGYGTAELHFGIDEQEIIGILEDNEYVFFVFGSSSAVVTGWQLGEDIAVYGRTPEWLLTKRGAMPITICDATAETIARSVVESVQDFVVTGDVSGVGELMDYSATDVQSLYDAVCRILKPQKLGFEVFPDITARQFVFRVYEGVESLCMFSLSNRTAYDMEYWADKHSMVDNSGWYKRRYIDMGGWDAENNSPTLQNGNEENAYTFYRITSESYDSNGERNEAFDLWCRKDTYLYCDNPNGVWSISESRPDTLWVYAGESQKTGAEKWEAVLQGVKTEDEAIAELSQMTPRRSTSCEAYRLEYGKDYGLGDVVRVQLEFGSFKRTEQKRVTSVLICHDVDKSGVIPGLNSLEE